ncbi:MAG: TipAS antibiotic-recognition domain-containing protein [Anaerotignaceae bacterium]
MDSFTESIICKDDNKYGKELQEKYSYDVVFGTNKNFLNLSQSDFLVLESLEGEILNRLKKAVLGGVSSESLEAKEIVISHKKWLLYGLDKYTPYDHIQLGKLFVENKSLKNYYDSEVIGCANFLKNSILLWANKI